MLTSYILLHPSSYYSIQSTAYALITLVPTIFERISNIWRAFELHFVIKLGFFLHLLEKLGSHYSENLALQVFAINYLLTVIQET